ncbi:MAG: putative Acid phosphatase [Nitrospira sp.]|nr:putative Acid phosphatase [Nitrospira sp.]
MTLLYQPGPLSAQTSLPKPDHIVLVIEENHAFSQIIGSPAAPYLNALAQQGALLTNSHGVTYPSQPNYLVLFAGSTEGIIGNNCPLTLTAPNLRSTLAEVGQSFAGYAEDLPAVGSTDCVAGSYVRKHNPWVNWQSSFINEIPPSENRPFSDFPTDFSILPTVSIVIPNQQNDMHDGRYPDRVSRGDQWLKTHLDRYVQWAETHNSMLIVTWDEDNGRHDNHIPTIVVGPMVRPGRYDEKLDHYGLLRTIEDMYGANPVGLSRDALPLTSIWNGSSTNP